METWSHMEWINGYLVECMDVMGWIEWMGMDGHRAARVGSPMPAVETAFVARLAPMSIGALRISSLACGKRRCYQPSTSTQTHAQLLYTLSVHTHTHIHTRMQVSALQNELVGSQAVAREQREHVAALRDKLAQRDAELQASPGLPTVY